MFKNYNAEYIYGTYGELLKGDTNLTSYLYNGKYGVMTDENGLYYMRHRYYNTDIRRFVNQDIVKGNLGNSQSLNRYSYVQGNPLTYTDPFGLSPEKDGGSIGMNIVHGLLDALGCVPGGVGIVANFANAALYAVVDHDYGMAALSLVAGVTLGASKIVSMGGKLAGHAKSIETIGKLVSNTASFAICAEQTVSSAAAMWNKYHEKGAKLSGETALEILGIGLNVAGMAASGKGIIESGNRLGKMVKEGGTTNKMSKGISKGGKETELFLPNEYYQKLDVNIANAIVARDAEVARIQGLSKTQQSNIATVVAGVDIRTGEVYVGVKNSRTYRGNATCAEDIVFRGLGGNTNANIIMTPAIRPRNNEVIPVCARCQTKYPQNQFVKGTTFQ